MCSHSGRMYRVMRRLADASSWKTEPHDRTARRRLSYDRSESHVLHRLPTRHGSSEGSSAGAFWCRLAHIAILTYRITVRSCRRVQCGAQPCRVFASRGPEVRVPVAPPQIAHQNKEARRAIGGLLCSWSQSCSQSRLLWFIGLLIRRERAHAIRRTAQHLRYMILLRA